MNNLAVILETERLRLREMDSALDAGFIFALLNTPKFLAFIGERGVRSIRDAAAFIENRYRPSYKDHGFGLYTVESKAESVQIGICGFVKRDSLPGPDIGFAFLPEFEAKGYGFESASAMLRHGWETLGFDRVLAVTSMDNEASECLLKKLGFSFDGVKENDGESLKIYSIPGF